MIRTATASAVSTGSPEQVFRHLATAEAWPVWMRVPTRSRRSRSGAPDPDGVGAVRSIFPMRERVVAYEPSSHYAYTLVTPTPFKDYQADVRLSPTAEGGTLIEWSARAGAVVPGTGGAVGFGLRFLARQLAGRLAAHTSACGGKCPVR